MTGDGVIAMRKPYINALLLAALAAMTAACEESTDPSTSRYDLALFMIANTKAAQLLRTDVMPVRAHSFDLETGSYPTLLLKDVTTDAVKEGLLEQVHLVSRLERNDVALKENSDLYYADTGQAIHWASKVSGASSFTDKAPSAPGKSQLEDHKQAVRVALEHIGRLELLRPTAEEKVDIVAVAQVMNALVEDGKNEPFESFPSDYLVVFGRRYRDNPVIGSYLQLRIGPDGKLLGLQRNWRQISQRDKGQTRVDEAKLDELMVKHFQETGVAKNHKDVDNIEVLSRVCGYLEGPVSYRQNSCGVGCLVNYRHSGDEMITATSFMLDDYAYPPLGQAPKRERLQQGLGQVVSKQPDHIPSDLGIKDEGLPDEQR